MAIQGKQRYLFLIYFTFGRETFVSVLFTHLLIAATQDLKLSPVAHTVSTKRNSVI